MLTDLITACVCVCERERERERVGSSRMHDDLAFGVGLHSNRLIGSVKSKMGGTFLSRKAISERSQVWYTVKS